MSEYNSSIINKYGDRGNVPKDCKTIFEILDRQGNDLLIDCLAEYNARAVNKYNLSESDRKHLIESLLKNIQEALLERI